MAVLSGSICTRGGKALLSRQFCEVTKDRIAELLANFPSLISNSESQHTTVEDDSVRYVYQPLEEFYIVLITNKSSNILQDIQTLHLFASTVSNILRSIDEREIFDNAFEIISAFDEVINLGYKENLTLSQVQTFLEMDSHEEKIQDIIERNKELEAAEERRRRAKEIQRKELARRNMEQAAPFARSAWTESDSFSSYSAPKTVYEPASIATQQQPLKPSLGTKPISSKGGLQLGKKVSKGGESHQPLLGQPASEINLTNNVQPQFSHPLPSSRESRSATPTQSLPKVENNGILVTVNEKISAELTREGSVISSEVKGDLQLRINNPDLAHSKILLKTGGKTSGVQYKTHPNIDRNSFNEQSVIVLKDKGKPFPSNDNSLGVVRWRVVGKSDETTLIPLLITAWVNMTDGNAEVTLEYEVVSDFIEANKSSSSLDDVKILVPVASEDVELRDESGNISYDVTASGVIFSLSSITFDDPQGSFEFSIPVPDENYLFPLRLQFEINKTDANESDISIGKVSVIDVVTNNDDEESLPFDFHSNISTEEYTVV
ncbi:Piso0_002384 [Millerozyma farinosa CBS 7064]|uniref:Coatomer subunit delta n=1 Tax=Pichia sorbitophila (strain ATCC MYA-4447 / BCRC 22081 / CBS 7064 / NBRC 10061 / NRRL Y-12695) TaxID=559304 RepID=G8YEW9_PICSO|nr:Piso0_002384 [Millerozyma farinosa CBS 7064]